MSDAVQYEGERAGVPPRAALVYSLFFLSGVAALVYEASWSRLVGLAIGQTAHAAAIVLAAYFTGMAVGQFFGGRLAPRVPPLLGYGVAELVAAAWACLVPALLDWVGAPAGQGDLELFRDSSGGRAVWCFLILLPATVPLGMTLPMVVEALTAGAGSWRRGPVAYGLNTAGGVVGLVAASAFLMIVAGVRASGFLAAALSAACGLTACLTAIRRRDRSEREVPGALAGEKVEGSWAWSVLAAISGFGTLGLEVLYTRMFALVFHNSTYTFGAVVAVFLLALSIGAALASWLGRRFSPRLVAIASFSLGSLALAVSVAAFPRLTGLSYFSFGETFAGYFAGAFGLVALFVLPPVMLLGMTLPAAIQAASGGRAVGRVTAANTLAGAVGAIAAGFLLPPLLGLWAAFGVLVALFAVAGVVLLVEAGSRRLAIALILTVSGPAVLIVSGPLPGVRDGGGKVVRRWESAYGWVDVVRTGQGDALAVRQNLHYRHGSTAYAVREYRQGRLPLLLHPKPAEVAFLGLGTGLTAAPAVVDKDVEKAVVVELIPEVVEASRLLASANLGVVDHPKVEVHIDDARHHLLRTNRRFDVIVSDLFVPWRAGPVTSTPSSSTRRCDAGSSPAGCSASGLPCTNSAPSSSS